MLLLFFFPGQHFRHFVSSVGPMLLLLFSQASMFGRKPPVLSCVIPASNRWHASLIPSPVFAPAFPLHSFTCTVCPPTRAAPRHARSNHNRQPVTALSLPLHFFLHACASFVCAGAPPGLQLRRSMQAPSHARDEGLSQQSSACVQATVQGPARAAALWCLSGWTHAAPLRVFGAQRTPTAPGCRLPHRRPLQLSGGNSGSRACRHEATS